jgi:hypothetical protein
MAAITNQEAIRLVNEQVRPLCEKVRALTAEIAAMKTTWDGGINAVIGSNANDTLEDGREAEGVSRLNALQITQAVGQLTGITPNAEIIAKPCVRPLEAN